MEAELKFERENINGVAVVGSYLIDAARRLGVEIFDECGRLGLCDTCAVTVKSGAEFLTEPTKAELELLSEERRLMGERLSCQAKIAGEGEIVIETHEKKDPRSEAERKHEEFRKEFDALPLEQKVAQLFELEMVALNETFSYVLNSPYKIGGIVVDFLSQFGLKFDRADQDAKRPEDHKEEAAKEAAEAAAENAGEESVVEAVAEVADEPAEEVAAEVADEPIVDDVNKEKASSKEKKKTDEEADHPEA